MTATAVPATFDGLVSLLPPDLRAMADPLIAMLPPETRDGLAAAVPALLDALRARDRVTFGAECERIGLGMFASLLWTQADAYLAQE